MFVFLNISTLENRVGKSNDHFIGLDFEINFIHKLEINKCYVNLALYFSHSRHKKQQLNIHRSFKLFCEIDIIIHPAKNASFLS